MSFTRPGYIRRFKPKILPRRPKRCDRCGASRAFFRVGTSRRCYNCRNP